MEVTFMQKERKLTQAARILAFFVYSSSGSKGNTIRNAGHDLPTLSIGYVPTPFLFVHSFGIVEHTNNSSLVFTIGS